ncbi:hypothetical protein QBC37DRAFT_198198 [Rhypophila decipiens]|uniref:Uncharacterized protein n=1 Tax=Rhypophila decipiens TaxID=261697 RepID=A0AAN6YH07_9PEZI|nr:hypothetical protein QBC37DRAFT_198198 [Rhypophila decipiens]
MEPGNIILGQVLDVSPFLFFSKASWVQIPDSTCTVPDFLPSYIKHLTTGAPLHGKSCNNDAQTTRLGTGKVALIIGVPPVGCTCLKLPFWSWNSSCQLLPVRLLAWKPSTLQISHCSLYAKNHRSPARKPFHFLLAWDARSQDYHGYTRHRLMAPFWPWSRCQFTNHTEIVVRVTAISPAVQTSHSPGWCMHYRLITDAPRLLGPCHDSYQSHNLQLAVICRSCALTAAQQQNHTEHKFLLNSRNQPSLAKIGSFSHLQPGH